MYIDSFESSQEIKQNFVAKICRHPLFLTLIGPSFLILNLAALVAFFSLPSLLFSFAAVLGYIAAWKYQIKGALYSFGLLGFTCAFLFMMESLPFSSGMTSLFFLSFSSSYFLLGLTSDAYCVLEQESLTEQEKKTSALQATYATNLQYLENQLDDQVEHGKSLDKALKIQDKELLSLKEVIKMSHFEAEKYKQQSYEHQKAIEKYHLALVDYEKQQDKIEQIEARAKSLLNNLNHVRVERFQEKLLLEDCQQHIKALAKPSCISSENSHDELHHLQQERYKMKQHYQTKLKQYQDAANQIEAFYEQAEEGPLTDPSKCFQMLASFENQAKVLQDIRLDILKIEEAILHVRKELKLSDEEGLSPGSYLAVADQECARLEEENSLLLKLLAQLARQLQPKNDLPV